MRSINRIAWMWDEALHALEQAERRQRHFCALGGPAAQPLWEPPADVFEGEKEIVICIALPGVRSESVTVQIVANALVVSAERLLPPELAQLRISRLEIPYGRFERQLELQSGRYVVVQRRMADGCLTLTLSKE